MSIKKFLPLLALPLTAKMVYAHCPLCTAGAAAAAGGAMWLGVNNAAIGVFIGAFAVSMGWWLSKFIKRQYVPLQRSIIILLSFITTILPLLPLLADKQGFYLSLIGDYGSLLNRTYLIDLFLVGIIIGGFIVSIAPWLSKKIAELRNGRAMPYQGIILTFALLIIAGVAVQLLA